MIYRALLWKASSRHFQNFKIITNLTVLYKSGWMQVKNLFFFRNRNTRYIQHFYWQVLCLYTCWKSLIFANLFMEFWSQQICCVCYQRYFQHSVSLMCSLFIHKRGFVRWFFAWSSIYMFVLKLQDTLLYFCMLTILLLW